MNVGPGADQKPATATRIHDCHLGGTHNFPADRAAAQAVCQRFPRTPAIARASVHRSVRYLPDNGVRQFLDVGSGKPTVGNVQQITLRIVPQS